MLTTIHPPQSCETIKMTAPQFTYTDVLRENSAYIGGVVIIGMAYFIYSVSTRDSGNLRNS